MAGEQTSYVGDDIKVLVNVIDSTGSHVAATINTSTTRLNGFSTVPTVNTIGTGIYEVVFASVTPAPAEGDRLIAKINGAITSTGTAWTEYAIALKILADERGTDNVVVPTSDITAIKTKTDQLTFTVANQVDANSLTGGTSPADIYTYFTTGTNEDVFKADTSTLATSAALSGVETKIDTIDTNVDSILVDTGTDIPASIAALNDLSSLDVENAVWDASLSSHNTGGTTGKSLKQIKEGTITIESSINDASATTTSFVTALTETTTSYYSNKIMVFIDGHLSGQARIITNYDGTTKIITLEEPLTSAPADGDQFLILATHENSVAEIADGVWNEAQSGHTTVGTFGYYLDAQVSALATQSSVNTIDLNVDAIKVKTDQLTFTNPNSVDATATSDVDEAAIADAVIAGIGGTDVTISSVIAEDGTTITIVRGDDYSASDSRAITWTGTTDDQWPSLSGATLKFTAKNNMDSLTVTPTVTQPTGTQAFRMELTSTNTEIMSGRYKYDVQATLSSGRVITLVVGEMIVKQTYTDRP